ncbi:MAG: hypothetical protein AB7F43_03540 [Bacteriovoracia bacterium]
MKQAKLNLVFLNGGSGYQDYLRPFFEGQFKGQIQTYFYDQSQGDVELSDLKSELEETSQFGTSGSRLAILGAELWP